MLRIKDVLKRLSDDDWGRLSKDLAVSVTAETWPAELTATLARGIRFRPQTLSSGDTRQRARLLRRALERASPEDATPTILLLHSYARRPLQERVYEVIGTTCGQPVASYDDALPPDVDVDAIVAAVLRLQEEMPASDLRVFLAAAIPWWRTAWTGAGPLADALDAVLAQELTAAPQAAAAVGAITGGPVAPVPPPEAAAPTSEQAEPESVLVQAPSFTTLDTVLIRATVSSLNGVMGSLDRDQLDDLVLEIIEMNDSRYQSWFHRGFLDALQERALAPMEGAENRHRRAWRLAGYFQGLLRRLPAKAVLEALAALSPADRDVLLAAPASEAGATLAQFVIVPLLKDGQVDEALAWMKLYLVAVAPFVTTDILEWSRLELVRGEAASVRRVLEAVRERSDAMTSAHGGVPDGVQRLLERRFAIALRCEGRLREAELCIDALLTDSTDPVERARLLSDKALITMGIERVETFALPDLATRPAFLASIERARPQLLAAEGAAAPTPTALVALAVPVVARKEANDAERTEAIARLRLALDAMSADSPGFWLQTGLMSRCRFYLAVLELRGLNPALAPMAMDRLRKLLEAGIDVPIDLLEDALVAAIVMDAPKVADVARLALQKHPRRMLECLDLASLVERSPGFRQSVVDVLVRTAASMTPAERWKAWSETLQGSLAAPDRDLETAAQALDVLEELAHEGGHEQQFLALLEDPRKWEPAWSLGDVRTARALLCESTGRLADARALLRQLAHAALTEDKLTLAEDLRDRMLQLGEAPEDLADIDQRIAAALRPSAPVASLVRETNLRRARVMFLGGDERQRQYEDELRGLIGEEHASVDLLIEYPGWGSNWGRLLDRIEPKIVQSHAIVLMAFVRTEFGRRVRKLASEAGVPWVPCTGHGLQSLHRAVGRACELARERA